MTIPNRDHQHGGMEAVGQLAQQMKGAMRYGGSNWPRLTPGEREALDMICHKIARILSGADPHDHQHWEDVAGYAHAVMRGQSQTTTTDTP
jgi:hypothetical protein